MKRVGSRRFAGQAAMAAGVAAAGWFGASVLFFLGIPGPECLAVLASSWATAAAAFLLSAGIGKMPAVPFLASAAIFDTAAVAACAIIYMIAGGAEFVIPWAAAFAGAFVSCAIAACMARYAVDRNGAFAGALIGGAIAACAALFAITEMPSFLYPGTMSFAGAFIACAAKPMGKN